MTAATRAFKRLVLMSADAEFIQYLEHLESARANRPLHQLAENTDGLLEGLVSFRNAVMWGSSDVAALAYSESGEDLTLSGGNIYLRFPGIIGDGVDVAEYNTVTNVLLQAAIASLPGGILDDGVWLVVVVNRTDVTPTVVAYQDTAALISAMQADPAEALDYFPLVYRSGSHLWVFYANQWLAPGESLRAGLREYVSQAESDLVHDDLVQDRGLFMVGGLVGGEFVRFSWDADTGTLSWDGTWYVKGRSATTTGRGPFNNSVAVGSVVLAAQGEVAWLTLDRSDDTGGAVSVSHGTEVPTTGRDDTFVFAVWADDDRVYLWQGTVIEDGGSATLGGSPVGVSWYLSGQWDGSGGPAAGVMVLETQTAGDVDLELTGATGPAAYNYGGHHIMVYVNGELQKGGHATGVDLAAQHADALSQSFHYFEVQDGSSGIGTSICWVTGEDPQGVPVSPPGTDDFIEVYLPAGSSVGVPGKWQRVQVLGISSAQTDTSDFPVPGTTAEYVVAAAEEADWYALADHAGVYLEVDHDADGGGDPETATAVGDGSFANSGDGLDASSSYDPLSGALDLVFLGGDREITEVRYYYLAAGSTDEVRVEGAGNVLPILPLGGVVLRSYYYQHPGSDKTTLVIDATVAGGVSSLNALSGALELVAGVGVEVTPGGSEIEVALSDSVPVLDSGMGGAAGSASLALVAAHDAAAGPPSADNPFVAADSTLVVETEEQRAGAQAVLDAAPGLSATSPLLALEMVRELLVTRGVTLLTRPHSPMSTSTTYCGMLGTGAIVLPFVGEGRHTDLHVLRPSEDVEKLVSGNVVGDPLAAGKWAWVYLVEPEEDSQEALSYELSAAVAVFKYSLVGPARHDEEDAYFGRMVHPDFLALADPRRAGVPLACFLVHNASQLLCNQTYDYDTGLLSLGFEDASLNCCFSHAFSGAGSTTKDLKPGEVGYLGLHGNSARTLLPQDAAGYPTYVRGLRVCVCWEAAGANAACEVKLNAGDYSGNTAAATAKFAGDAAGAVQSQTLDVWLPATDNLHGTYRDYGQVEVSAVVGSGGGTLSVYLVGVWFKPGFWSKT